LPSVRKKINKLTKSVVVAVLALSGAKLHAALAFSQSPALVQGSKSSSTSAGSVQQNSSPQNQQTTPQNSPPPDQNPAVPIQQPAPSQQIPAPSAQLPEPAIKNPEAKPAPKPAGQAPTVTVPRLDHPPSLEDFVSMKPEGVGRQMAEISGLVQRNPHDGEAVSEVTRAYLGYDQKNIYVVFVCFDDPKQVRARMSAREDIYDDDEVAVLFDTFHDRRRAYEFQTTPLGVQWDAIYTEAVRAEVGGNWDTSWDAVWDSKGKVTSQGYVVWMAIPFKSLRFPATRQQQWGLVFYRHITRKNEESFWPYVSRKVQGRLEYEATLLGIEGISPGRDIELIPYGIMRGFRGLQTRDPEDPYFQSAVAQGQTGLDAKFVIKDHFVVDMTANPDFSQVESEDPQITVNQRFEVYFPEKRPFFLENEDFFRTPIDLFFTRNIQDPSAGIRLTGKEGPYSVGLMATDDRAPGLAIPNYCPSFSLDCLDNLYGIRSYFSVARVNRDIFKQSSIGAIYTDWECPSTGEYNRVGGADVWLKPNDSWTIQAQAVTSSSHLLGLNATNPFSTCEANQFPFSSGNVGNGNYYAGPADNVQVVRTGLHFNYIGTYQDVSPGFVTVPGFVNRTDIRGTYNTVYYRFRPKKGWLLSWGPSLRQRYVFDHEGNRLDTYYDPYFRIEARGQTVLILDPYIELRERLRPQDFAFIGLPGVTHNQDYHEHSSEVDFYTSYFRKFALRSTYSWGNAANYSPAANALPQYLLSRSNNATVSLSFRPMEPLKIENTYLFERLRAPESTYLQAVTQTPGIGKGIFNDHIIRSKWNWQFTPQLSMRVIMQYNGLLANTPGNNIYPYTYLPTQKEFNADLLFTYLIHPGTAIYVGYNSDLQNLDHDLPQGPEGPAGLYTAKGLMNDSRQFFVKASYQFRF
jgi:hypothetical protein